MTYPKRISPFETIRRIDENGEDYWPARELVALLGYARWEDAKTAVDHAMHDCERADRSVEENFRDIPKVPGKRGPKQESYRLTEKGCKDPVFQAGDISSFACGRHRTRCLKQL